MKKIILLAVTVIFSKGYSQTTSDSLQAWAEGGTGTLNFSQVSLSNWAQGGENSLSATALLTYGFLQSGNNGLRKSDDKIELSSKYGYKTANKWSFATLLSFKSQTTQGYNYPNDSVLISNFLAPGYITISTGMDYKPKDDFSFFMSPITGKITIVNDQTLADAGAYGVDKALFDTAGVKTKSGKKIRYEFGALVSAKFKQAIAKNITLSTKLDLFSNYFQNPENIDVNWDLLLNMKVNKFISASISTTLIYDHDIPVASYNTLNGVKIQTGAGPRTQFKEVFALGFSYKF
jgi:hypothetical protein